MERFKGSEPKNIFGLKLVKKGKDNSETNRNLEEVINSLIISYTHKDKAVEISIYE